LSNIFAVSGKSAVARLAEKHRGRRVSVARHPHPDEFHPTRRQFVLSALQKAIAKFVGWPSFMRKGYS